MVLHQTGDKPLSQPMMAYFTDAYLRHSTPMRSNRDSSHNLFLNPAFHYTDVIMGAMESQITGVSIVHSTVSSGADQGKHKSSTSLAFVWRSHRWPVHSPHKGPVTWKIFPFDDVIMRYLATVIMYAWRMRMSLRWLSIFDFIEIIQKCSDKTW